MSGNVAARLAAALAELEQLRAENARLRGLLGLDDQWTSSPAQVWEPMLLREEPEIEAVNEGSSAETKLALFQSLFVGRDDVYAVRWRSARSGKAGWAPAVRGGWSHADRRSKDYLPLTEQVIGGHLSGREHVGLYPLLEEDMCRLLACDFDGAGWAPDGLAYFHACTVAGVAAALERSRSGDGAHVWIFFSGPVTAAVARTLGAMLLREAMTARAELDLDSYDRLFPSQDFMPKGSFGNLIALPLHGKSRHDGTTVFLDPATLKPWPDQWALLSALPRLSPEAVDSLVAARRPVDAGPQAVTLKLGVGPTPPAEIRAELAGMLSIERFGLPPALLPASGTSRRCTIPSFTRSSGCGYPRGGRRDSSVAISRHSIAY